MAAPIRLAVSNLNVRQVNLTVKFRGEKLALEKLERGTGRADVQVQDYVRSRKQGEFSVLKITATALPSGAA